MTDAKPMSRLLANYSIEITPGGKDNVETCRQYLSRGTEIYIASPPPDLHKHAAETARQVRAAGFEPIPHIAARSVPSTALLDELLARMAGDSGVTRVLCIGGDVPRSAGPYKSSLEVIETGLLQKHGISRVSVAFYVESHPKIGDSEIESALTAKLAYLAKHGLEPLLVSQFCFEEEPIVARIRQLRSDGVTARLRIGVAGPASRKTLWNYAVRCGIGNSIRALGTQAERIQQLLTRDTPEILLQAVAARLGPPDALGVDGVHFFTFGGVGETARWVNGIVGA